MSLITKWFIILTLLGMGYMLCEPLNGQDLPFNIDFPLLDQKTPSSIVQDKYGYIWLKSKTSIQRFDGHNFYALPLKKIFQSEKIDIQTTNDFVFLDEENFLLTVGQNLQLVDIYNHSYKTIWTLPDSLQFKYIYEADDGTPWIFTSNKLRTFSPIYSISKDQKVNYRFDLFEAILNINVDFQSEMTERNNNFYFHGIFTGLKIINTDGKRIQLPVNNYNQFRKDSICTTFKLDNKNNLWRLDATSFEMLNEKTLDFEFHPLSGRLRNSGLCRKKTNLKNWYTSHIFEDSKNRIWLGREDSFLYCYDPKSDILYNFRNVIVNKLNYGGSGIALIMEDRDGNIWAKQRGGVVKISDKNLLFKSYARNTNLASHPIYHQNDPAVVTTIDKTRAFFGDRAIIKTDISFIEEDSDNNILFGDSRFVFKIDRSTDNLEVLPFFTPKEKTHLLVSSTVNLLSTWSRYYTFDSEYTKLNKVNGEPKIVDFFQQKNGETWAFGVVNQAGDKILTKLNPDTYELSLAGQAKNELFDFKNSWLCGLEEDDDSFIWFGHNNGISRYSPKESSILRTIESFTHENKHIKLSVRHFKLVEEKKIWCSNSEYIVKIDLATNKKIFYKTRLELGIPDIKGFLPFGKDKVWLFTKQGLFYYDFQTEKRLQFTKADGLDCDYIDVYELLNNGEMALGTNNGLFVYHPDSLLTKSVLAEQNMKKIPLFLNAWSVLDGKSDTIVSYQFLKDFKKTIELEYNDKLLNLEFGLMNLTASDRNEYSYYLEGFENDWSQPSKLSFARYTGLPAGSYTFKARGSSGKGIWSDRILEIPIIVKQAWFRTWWFLLSAIGAISFLIFGAVNYDFQRKLEKRMAIEQLRVKISSDLHDDVGTTLTGLAMQSEILAAVSDEKSKKQLDRISKLARAAMSTMRDAVWTMDTRKDNWQSLVDRMLEFASETLETKNIGYTIHHNYLDTSLHLNSEIRQNLYLIYKEAITNVAKHSVATQVEVNLNSNDSGFNMEISDNGIVSSQKTNSSGLGLSNMKLRAQKIDAILEIRTENGFSISISG